VLGEVSKSLITAQLDWMKTQFRLMGKGSRAGDLERFALLSCTQGSALLAHVLGDLCSISGAADSRSDRNGGFAAKFIEIRARGEGVARD